MTTEAGQRLKARLGLGAGLVADTSYDGQFAEFRAKAVADHPDMTAEAAVAKRAQDHPDEVERLNSAPRIPAVTKAAPEASPGTDYFDDIREMVIDVMAEENVDEFTALNKVLDSRAGAARMAAYQEACGNANGVDNAIRIAKAATS